VSRAGLLGLLALAACSQLPAQLKSPKKVVAHLIGGVDPLGTGGQKQKSFSGFVSAEQRELTKEQVGTLRDLIADGALSTKTDEGKLCSFNGDLALEWVGESGSVDTLLCFTCGDAMGSAGFHTFDRRKLGAFAKELFPAHEPFARAAAGQSPH
jgi:hypothetical protein